MSNAFIDNLTGEEFEIYLAKLFAGLGYKVKLTSASNDYGADLVIEKQGLITVVQAKRYSSTVGISSIQEVIGAKKYYNANDCLVVTNNYFTNNAIKLAYANSVQLWDRTKLFNKMSKSLIYEQRGNENKCKTLNINKYSSNATMDEPILIGVYENKFYEMELSKLSNTLITGSSGSGKSMLLHAIIHSIMEHDIDTTKMLLVDTKGLEFNFYNNEYPLLLPVATTIKDIKFLFQWIEDEFEKRIAILNNSSSRDIDAYNEKSIQKLPKIVIIIDELFELITLDEQDFANLLKNIYNFSRETGIYLIVSTQSIPTINKYKHYFESIITFKLKSEFDSRQVINSIGAETLNNDSMLFSNNNVGIIQLNKVYIDNSFFPTIKKSIVSNHKTSHTKHKNVDNVELKDELINNDLFEKALRLAENKGTASIDMLSRYLGIDYHEAALIIDTMESKGYISGLDSNKPRTDLINKQDSDTIETLKSVSEKPKFKTILKKILSFYYIFNCYAIAIILLILFLGLINDPSINFIVKIGLLSFSIFLFYKGHQIWKNRK